VYNWAVFDVRTAAAGSAARLGTLTTLHGAVETPVFMPVGTRGAVRTQTMSQLEALGPRLILANTYHLLVRPGIELFERLGGLHRWIGWPHAVLTDSGGFQVFSLASTVSEDGVTFGRELLTPERSIAMQRAIGSDIMMVLDQCIAATSPHAAARDAMERTHRWAARSLAARGDSPQALFGIVQGACFPDLRRESARALAELPFDGFAIGGLAVGETRAQREDITELTAAVLPADRPRYLMGVGTPLDILEAVHRGVDMFDCILPTAWAQHGRAFTSHGRIDLRRGVHKLAEQPLDAACSCEACARHSRSYLHHLIKCEEPLGWQLLEGDFLEQFRDAPQPDVIFYDPFSSKVDAPLWSLETFRALRAHLTGAVELLTYSKSTAIRSSLLAAGFHVARGVASGPKEETTIAMTVPLPGHALLGREWLERRARSSAPCPAEVERLVLAHPQFTPRA
jgi:queuine tRNA-ribosyltransferase